MAEMCILEIYIDTQVTKDTCISNVTKAVEQIESTEKLDILHTATD